MPKQKSANKFKLKSQDFSQKQSVSLLSQNRYERSNIELRTAAVIEAQFA